MGDIADTANEVFRDYVVDGVPSTGENDPDKADIRALFVLIDGEVVSGVIGYETWAALSGVSGTAAGNLAVVSAADGGTHTDPVVGGTVNNTGLFRWSASPAGWKRIDDLDGVRAKAWAEQTGSAVSGGEYSAKEYAVGTTTRGVAGKGSAKDWATLTAAQVDGAEYGAKEYSVGTTAAAGSSKSWATKTGATVDGAEYSAKEYAIGPDVDGLAGKGSAKAWASKASGSPDGGSNLSALQYAGQAGASATAAAASAAAAAAAIGAGLSITGRQQIIGRGVPPPVTGTGTAGVATYLWNDPITLTGTLEQLTGYFANSGNITLALYTKSGTTYTRVGSAVTIAVAAGLNTLTSANFGTINVVAGQYLAISPGTPGLRDDAGTPADGSGWVSGSAGCPASLTGSARTAPPCLEAGFVIAGATPVLGSTIALPAQDQPAQLSLDNVETCVTVSNSFYEGIACLKGKTNTQIVSALTEFNFANYSQEGLDIFQLTTSLKGKAGLSGTGGFTPWLAGAGYMMFSEQNNSYTHGLTNVQIATYYEGAIDIARAMGWEPVILTEYGGANAATFDNEQRGLKQMRNIADKNNVPLIDCTSKSRPMNPTAYAPFFLGQHPGTRLAYYFIAGVVRGVKQKLPRPLRSMKIFRVRGTVSPSGPNDLSFRTVEQRHHLFKELYLGQSPIADGSASFYDSLNVGTPPTQTVNDEYAALRGGTLVDLGQWALIDCVLPVYGARGVSLTLSDTSITVYVRRLEIDGTITWTQLPMIGGQYLVPDETYGYVDGDRIAFLLNKADIQLTASPIVAWQSGRERQRRWPSPWPTQRLMPPQGAEMLAQPLTVVGGVIPAQWTNAGSLLVATGDDATYPQGVTGVVEVTTTAGLSQQLTYAASNDSIEVSVRVWARRWVPIYASGGSFPTGAPVTYETCDTATLQCTLSGPSAITSASTQLVEQVGLAWTEIEWRETFECNPGGTMTVAVDVRSQDQNIQIAKVSVASVVH